MRYLLVALTVLLVAIAATAAPTAFVGVNVIPMDRDRVLEDQTVIVDGGKIKKIGPSRSTKVPDGVIQIDAKGKYLIPGLVDMHTHLMSDDAFPDALAPDELKVFIANGVTTIRLMIGTPEHLVLRAQSARGEIVAPTLWVASPHLTGREQGNNYVVNTPDEAREAVRKAKAAGYDFIKVTTYIKSLVYEAAVAEVQKQNIRVVGHADSRFVTVRRAWAAHQQIEHLDGYLEMLIKDGLPPLSVSDVYIYQPRNWESIDNVDENKIAEVARKTVESNPFVDPTQSFMKNTFGLPRTEESIRAQPDFKFYPIKTQDFYINYLKRTPLNQVSYEKRARWVDIRNKLIKAIYNAGGKIMAGSDTPEFLWLYGFTEHRELKALADAGLPNYAVLAAATRNAHEYLGSLKRSGTVEEGKDADLVLLDANPVADITNTEKRAGVMLKGKWYTQDELNKWLDEIAPKFHAVELEGDGKMILYLSRIAILGVLITISGNVCAAAVEKDLAYGTDAAQKLDLSVPSAKGFPTVIFVHGGSLSSGDKADTDYKDVCTPFPDAGIGCANINYRLFPADAWPVPGEDVAAAVAWVKKNIGARGGDPEKLFLFGHSSGATLVALIAADEKYLAKFGVKTGAVAGVIPMGSIMWDDEIEQSITRNGRQRVEEGFARRSASWGSFDTYLSYWPFNHIHASMPPYLFLIAEAEQINPPVLMTNSKFAEKSRSIGNVADFEVIPGRNHYGNIRRLHEKDDPVFVLVRDFIKKYASDGKK